MQIDVAGQQMPVRSGLATPIDNAWQRLARPGMWWSGGERIAIAAEVRKAETCTLCRQRKTVIVK